VPSVELGAMQALPPASPLGQRGALGPSISITFEVGKSRLSIEKFPLVRATVKKRASGGENRQNHCGSKQGIDIAGECWAFSRLERLCVQVERHNNGSWTLAPQVVGRKNSYGCDYAGGDWAVPIYGHMAMDGYGTHSTEQWPTGVVHYEDLVLEVRSHSDPYLRAQDLTGGTLSFGVSKEEEDAIGIVLIILGIGFSCPLVITCCRHWCKHRRSRRPSYYYPPPAQRWTTRTKPDPELVGMRFAVDKVGGHPTSPSMASEQAIGGDGAEEIRGHSVAGARE